MSPPDPIARLRERLLEDADEDTCDDFQPGGYDSERCCTRCGQERQCHDWKAAADALARLQQERDELLAEQEKYDVMREAYMDHMKKREDTLRQDLQHMLDTCVPVQERDDAIGERDDIRVALLNGEPDDINQPTVVLAENIQALWKEAEARVDRLTAALRAVHDTFVKDEAQGYQSRDRQFAIEILAAALAPDEVKS